MFLTERFMPSLTPFLPLKPFLRVRSRSYGFCAMSLLSHPRKCVNSGPLDLTTVSTFLTRLTSFSLVTNVVLLLFYYPCIVLLLYIIPPFPISQHKGYHFFESSCHIVCV
ncbi:hypothetical protein TRVL_01696 [Trypanosoma vivax]|nr:hypothetical protein TRVL_01696 [Trypanosoma vivax]